MDFSKVSGRIDILEIEEFLSDINFDELVKEIEEALK